MLPCGSQATSVGRQKIYDDRQVWQGRQVAEGVRNGQYHRLPQRKYALRWRDRQSAGAEAGAALSCAGETDGKRRTVRFNTFSWCMECIVRYFLFLVG